MSLNARIRIHNNQVSDFCQNQVSRFFHYLLRRKNCLPEIDSPKNIFILITQNDARGP
jgi:hypothetical protein